MSGLIDDDDHGTIAHQPLMAASYPNWSLIGRGRLTEAGRKRPVRSGSCRGRERTFVDPEILPVKVNPRLL